MNNKLYISVQKAHSSDKSQRNVSCCSIIYKNKISSSLFFDTDYEQSIKSVGIWIKENIDHDIEQIVYFNNSSMPYNLITRIALHLKEKPSSEFLNEITNDLCLSKWRKLFIDENNYLVLARQLHKLEKEDASNFEDGYMANIISKYIIQKKNNLIENNGILKIVNEILEKKELEKYNEINLKIVYWLDTNNNPKEFAEEHIESFKNICSNLIV